MHPEIIFEEATEHARAIRAKEISPVELVEAYLERIEELDPQINAFVTVVADKAIDEAKAAEGVVARGGELGRFHGVPISIKDLTETAGIRTTFSTRSLAEYIPVDDDNVVRKVKEAGFIVVGKSNTSEFGTVPVTESVLNGACRNPWDLEHTPGGSSGGAAAGIAAGLVPIAHGADGGGSIRIPASCCGLYGIKPSRGRISAGPRMGEHWHGFSTSGPIARTVKDAAALLDAMEGYCTGDPYMAPHPTRPFEEEANLEPPPLRIAFTSESPNEVEIEPEMRVALDRAAKLLESLGHEVEELRPPWVDPAVQPYFVQLIATGTSVVDFLPHDQLEPLNRFLVESAAEISSIQHMQALMAVHQYARKTAAFWDRFDLVLTPTLGKVPVPVGWIFEEDDPVSHLIRSGQFIPFTPYANVTGQPAASVPLHWSQEGLPVGVQLIGRYADDATVIRVSAQLEEAQPWKDRRPPLFEQTYSPASQ